LANEGPAADGITMVGTCVGDHMAKEEDREAAEGQANKSLLKTKQGVP
jgi:hypothetical protein